MYDRKSLLFTLWITSSLALLVSILLAPIQTSALVTILSRPDGIRRYFNLLMDQPTTRLSAGMGTDAVLEMDALPSENEEQDRADALDEPRVSVTLACFFHKLVNRQSIAPHTIVSLYPLRC